MSGKLSRRSLLALGVSGAVAAAGCSSAATSAKSGVPRPGGMIRAVFAGGGPKETLDPHSPLLFIDQARHKAIYDKLFELGADMRAVPRLAEHAEADQNAIRWRITLRDAKFHHGRPVTADDVLSSLARILQPSETPRTARNLLSTLDLANSRAIDPRTVELAMKTPSSELPLLLAGTGNAIMPADQVNTTAPVGSGPFRFVSFEPGRELVAQRFDDYWEGPAHVDELRILSGDDTARGNALLAGQAEYAHDMSATFARTQQRGSEVDIIRSPSSAMQGFAMKTDRPPFDNPDVRKAMRLLADRERLVQVALSGMGQVGNDLFGKGYEHYPEDLPQRHHDPDQAKWLLRKAGADKLTFALDTAEVGSGVVNAATLFAEQVRQAGVGVEMSVRNKDSFFTDMLTSGSISSYRVGAMPITQDLLLRYLSKSPQNVTAWRHPEFDRIFRESQGTVDEQRRDELYRSLQHRLYEDGGMLGWGHSDWIVASGKALQGVRPAPANTVDWARFDRVWLEE